MKKYVRPSLLIEQIDLCDLILASNLTIGEVHDINDSGNIFDEIF